MPERLECEVLQKERYINPLTYLPTYLPTYPVPTWNVIVVLKIVTMNSLSQLTLMVNTFYT